MKDIQKNKAGQPADSKLNQPCDSDLENSEGTTKKPKSNGISEHVVKNIPDNKRIVASGASKEEMETGAVEKERSEKDK